MGVAPTASARGWWSLPRAAALTSDGSPAPSQSTEGSTRGSAPRRAPGRAHRTPPSGVQRRAGPAWASPLRPESRSVRGSMLHRRCQPGSRPPRSGVTGTNRCRLEEDEPVRSVIDEGALPVLDARLRRVGEWLLVGYTVAMVLVTFVVPDRQEQAPAAPSDAVIEQL